MIGSGPDDLVAEASFPTTTPKETIDRAIAFFADYQQRGHRLAYLGIGSFGPVDLNPSSPTYGFITSTPKPGWANTDFAGRMSRALGLKVRFETDVNAAAVGEATWGAAIVEGRLLHGLVHSEMGHLRVPHDYAIDPFPGSCPFHGDCLEGLAAGPALMKRWEQPTELLLPNHPAWPLEAQYLALGIVNITCILSPERLVLGGGIMKQPTLLTAIRRKVQDLLNGYLQTPTILEYIDNYIMPAMLGNRAGALGAMELARLAN